MGLIFDGDQALTMADVSGRLNRDDTLLRQAICGLKHIGRFSHPAGAEPHPLDCTLAGRVSHVFGTGMTRAIELCRRFDQDPEFTEAGDAE